MMHDFIQLTPNQTLFPNPNPVSHVVHLYYSNLKCIITMIP